MVLYDCALEQRFIIWSKLVNLSRKKRSSTPMGDSVYLIQNRHNTLYAVEVRYEVVPLRFNKDHQVIEND